MAGVSLGLFACGLCNSVDLDFPCFYRPLGSTQAGAEFTDRSVGPVCALLGGCLAARTFTLEAQCEGWAAVVRGEGLGSCDELWREGVFSLSTTAEWTWGLKGPLCEWDSLSFGAS